MPLLTVLTPCFNEEGNVREVYEQVKAAMETVPDCDYEHLFIDNASRDGTVEILRELAAADKRVKVIVNTRNFGHVRSPIPCVPPGARGRGHELRRRPAGPSGAHPPVRREVARGVQGRHRCEAGQRGILAHVRAPGSFYYWLVAKLSSDVELVRNFTGFGLYDREVVEQFRSTEEQYPYFRGLVSDFGYERAEIDYMQPARTRGKHQERLLQPLRHRDAGDHKPLEGPAADRRRWPDSPFRS